MTVAYEMSHLDRLESEAVHIIREVAATIEKPALLFSGGKDSVVMLHVAAKAFWPAPVPFPVVHVDTGENFDEVLEFRDREVDRLGVRLDRRQRAGRHRRRPVGRGHRSERDPQPPADGDAAARRSRRTGSARCSAAPGATRRRPAPRSGCSASATSSASGTRATSGRSCGASTTAVTARARTSACSRCRTGPSWTSGPTSATRASSCRSCTTPTAARSSSATACCWRSTGSSSRRADETPFEATVRFRTIGDATCTGCVESLAATADDVVVEVAAARFTERGATRADDRISEAGMEDRKKEGYF